MIHNIGYVKWEMLMNALRTLVNNPFKESFYEKRKKKVINILIVFFFSFFIKIVSKLSYNELLTNALRVLVNMTYVKLSSVIKNGDFFSCKNINFCKKVLRTQKNCNSICLLLYFEKPRRIIKEE